MGFLLSVLAMLAAGAVVALLAWRRSHTQPVAETELEGAPAIDETLLPLTAVDVQGSDGDWTRHMMDLDPLGEVEGVIGSPGGLIAFGRTLGGDGEAGVWESPDGVAWKNVAILGPGSARLAVPWRDGLLVATVAERDGGARTTCWWSRDAGTWEQLTGDGEDALAGVSFEGGAAIGELIVTWGRRHDGHGVWFSRDGATWRESALQGGMDLIIPMGERFVAFGRKPDGRPVVAWSSDALTWDGPSEDTHFVFEGAWVTALAAFDGGMVAAGTDIMRGVAATWVSDDGHRWLRTPFAPGVGTHIAGMVVADDRLLAVGGGRERGRKRVALWESRDAVSWEPVAAGDLFTHAVARSALLVDGSVVVCGTLYAEGDDAQLEPIPVTWKSEVLRFDREPRRDAETPSAPAEPEVAPAR